MFLYVNTTQTVPEQDALITISLDATRHISSNNNSKTIYQIEMEGMRLGVCMYIEATQGIFASSASCSINTIFAEDMQRDAATTNYVQIAAALIRISTVAYPLRRVFSTSRRMYNIRVYIYVCNIFV